MRTTFNWRRGFVYSALVGAGMIVAFLAGLLGNLEAFAVCAITATLGSIAFAFGATNSKSFEWTQPALLEWIRDMIWRTIVGSFVGAISVLVVVTAYVAISIAAGVDLISRDRQTWLLGEATAIAAGSGALVGAMVGAWISRGRTLSTSIRGSAFGICLGCATGWIASRAISWVTYISLAYMFGLISGVVGAIFARRFMRPMTTQAPAGCRTSDQASGCEQYGNEPGPPKTI